ncbi:MAG: symmetrical bis(5'-nucleosyl)-tetraphosphatase [Oceanospirillum sp.]|nr:symmetrical bis(5'-nucleosyl)-tetraphosphatase [Oceanospirillum sp.]
MNTYAVGDLQGCFSELEQLLKAVHFDFDADQLWLAGDLVNRGPESLEVLRFASEMGDRVHCVLGNHDLHLLAVAYGGARLKRSDTLQAILDAPDSEKLLSWLRHQPLCHYDEKLGYVMTHAGIPPIWNLRQTLAYAREVEAVLQGQDYRAYFENMYGNKPAKWSDDLTGFDRLRAITNYFTRMRFCTAKGKLDFDSKEGLDQCPEGFAPWFSYPRKVKEKIIFGHWAALEGDVDAKGIFGLDTGCVWGGRLTALNLESGELTAVDSLQKSRY